MERAEGTEGAWLQWIKVARKKHWLHIDGLLAIFDVSFFGHFKRWKMASDLHS